jgi:hypothetical protein
MKEEVSLKKKKLARGHCTEEGNMSNTVNLKT